MKRETARPVELRKRLVCGWKSEGFGGWGVGPQKYETPKHRGKNQEKQLPRRKHKHTRLVFKASRSLSLSSRLRAFRSLKKRRKKATAPLDSTQKGGPESGQDSRETGRQGGNVETRRHPDRIPSSEPRSVEASSRTKGARGDAVARRDRAAAGGASTDGQGPSHHGIGRESDTRGGSQKHQSQTRARQCGQTAWGSQN